jgi:hypothetical protein
MFNPNEVVDNNLTVITWMLHIHVNGDFGCDGAKLRRAEDLLEI